MHNVTDLNAFDLFYLKTKKKKHLVFSILGNNYEVLTHFTTLALMLKLEKVKLVEMKR